MISLKKNRIDAKHINIKLKKINNISPEKYIPIIYATILIIIIFLISTLPGILNYGSEVILTSNPSGASVYINNIRVGSTPMTTFINSSNIEVEFKKSDFMTQQISKKIKGRLFFSLFSKRKNRIHTDLHSNNGKKILIKNYEEMAKWSLVNNSDISKRYQIPLLLSSSIKDYYYASDFEKVILNRFLKSSTKLITNENILSDYLRGLSIASSNNKMLSISAVKNSAKFISSILTEYEHVPILFYKKIIKNESVNLNNEFYNKLASKHRLSMNKNATSFAETGDDIKIKEDLTFKYIPDSKSTPRDVNFIHKIEQDQFYISEKMVSREDYLLFVENNPKWSINNIDELLSLKLVDQLYLNFERDEDYITNISYYSSIAWCEWANVYYDIPDGWKLTLPTENMWFSAVNYGVPKDIFAWQWTNQGFYLYDHFLTDDSGEVIESFTDVIPRLVVGKNKYNYKTESGRGVQDANWCSPFLSFRPVLVKE